MSAEDEIRQLLYDFAYSGLVEKSAEKFFNCYSDRILGIGIGEQGFVTSMDDVRRVYETGLKVEDTSVHTINFGRVEIMQLDEHYAIVCADIHCTSHPTEDSGKETHSQIQQSLTVERTPQGWKVCGIHASSSAVTEEDIEAYPIRFAEKTLQNLRDKIGEEAYLAEEQYRKAVLSDTIGFYIINFTTDRFEQCQLQNDLCVLVEDHTPYESFVIEKSVEHVYPEDRDLFVEHLSLSSIEKAFSNQTNEVSCEYRMKTPEGAYIWARTIIRLITDVVTGHKKGIMYVKDIDEEKRTSLKIQEMAEYDGMTMVLNKAAMVQEVDLLTGWRLGSEGGVFFMVDADNFKQVNDTYGHPVGDQVLIAIAELLRAFFPAPARIGRLGGDEFGVFLPDQILGETVKSKIEAFLSTVRGHRLAKTPQLCITVSIGAASLPSGGFESFYQAADQALYEAKKTGKNTVAYHNSAN